MEDRNELIAWWFQVKLVGFHYKLPRKWILQEANDFNNLRYTLTCKAEAGGIKLSGVITSCLIIDGN